MRLTATDKAIGEINMRRADMERARALLEKYSTSPIMDHPAWDGIADELALMDRCIDMLRSVAPQPKPEKPKVERKRKAKKAEAE